MVKRVKIALSALLLAACSQDPRALVLGRDSCAECRMVISERGFGGELVNRHGKVFTFDSIECLMKFLKENRGHEDDTVWLIDFETGNLVAAKDAHFVTGGETRSPMGGGIVAFASAFAAADFQAQSGGAAETWDQVTGAGANV